MINKLRKVSIFTVVFTNNFDPELGAKPGLKDQMVFTIDLARAGWGWKLILGRVTQPSSIEGSGRGSNI